MPAMTEGLRILFPRGNGGIFLGGWEMPRPGLIPGGGFYGDGKGENQAEREATSRSA